MNRRLRFSGGVFLAATLIDFATTPVIQLYARAEPPQSTVRFLYNDGNLPSLPLPDGKQRQIRSVLNARGRLQYGKFIWNERDVPAGSVWVLVNLHQQTISIFRAGHEIGTAVILYGADIKETPVGVFPVLEKAKTHRSTLYDAEMPYMLRLTGDGVAIHASDVRRGSATHGCIGVPLNFARLIFNNVKPGDVVAIVSGETGSKNAPV